MIITQKTNIAFSKEEVVELLLQHATLALAKQGMSLDNTSVSFNPDNSINITGESNADTTIAPEPVIKTPTLAPTPVKKKEVTKVALTPSTPKKAALTSVEDKEESVSNKIAKKLSDKGKAAPRASFKAVGNEDKTPTVDTDKTLQEMLKDSKESSGKGFSTSPGAANPFSKSKPPMRMPAGDPKNNFGI